MEKTEYQTKYQVVLLTEIIVYPSTSTGNIENIGNDLAKAIGNGYDLYKAIPFSTKEVAGIRYILRKKI